MEQRDAQFGVFGAVRTEESTGWPPRVSKKNEKSVSRVETKTHRIKSNTGKLRFRLSLQRVISKCKYSFRELENIINPARENENTLLAPTKLKLEIGKESDF